MSFSFLSDLVFEDDLAKKVPSYNDGPGTYLLFFDTNIVRPSLDAINTLNLEFGEGTNGLDIFTAHSWGAYSKTLPNILLCAVTNRSEPKISLFGQNDTDKSITDKLYKAEWLRKMIEEVYPSFRFPRRVNSRTPASVKLHIDTTTPLQLARPIVHIPKLKMKGADKGKATYVTRENVTIYPVSLSELTIPDTVDGTSNSEHGEVLTISTPRFTNSSGITITSPIPF